jgi:hypothetical protein
MHESRVVLYKYRRWNVNAVRILLFGELYYAKPSAFNDPFDFCLTMRTDGTEHQWFEFLTELVGPEEAGRVIGNGRWSLPEFQTQIRENMIQRQMRAGVFCMSRKSDDVLMWSHYADSHRGVCIEFSWDVERTATFDVDYVDEVPELSIFDSDWRDRVLKLLYTKSQRWSYEEEVRHIRKEGPGTVRVPRDCITAVITGCQMPASDVEGIEAIVKQSLPSAVVRRATAANDSFELVID